MQQSFTPPADYEHLRYLLLVAEFLLLDLAPDSRIGMTERSRADLYSISGDTRSSCPQHLQPSTLLLDTNRVLVSQQNMAHTGCVLYSKCFS